MSDIGLGNSFLDREVIDAITQEILAATALPECPVITISTRPGSHFQANVSKDAAKRKMKADELAAEIAGKTNAFAGRQFIDSITSGGAFINITVHVPKVAELTVRRVLSEGEAFGSSRLNVARTVLVEHTSANPNAPLHVGNLRSAMIGLHLSQLFKFTGWTVKEHFYVNDLGGQIGLSAIGYQRLLEANALPQEKPDMLIGKIYAIMNTLNQAQKLGWKTSEFVAAVLEAGVAVEEKEEEAEGKPEDPKAKKMKKSMLTPDQLAAKQVADRIETVKIGASLRTRFGALWEALLAVLPDTFQIAEESGRLNKAYEERDPAAVAVMRRMVCAALSGIQQTLDRYGVHHDQFDFESELSWDGSSQALIDRVRALGYYHEVTPQAGAWIDLDQFRQDAKLRSGKGGYQKDYPRFYATRKDGSTLYTLRDVTYSLFKLEQADLILNVICTEQNLAQEKVFLCMRLIGVDRRAQFHVQNEFVKLLDKGKVMRMSGRRGIYVTADEMFERLLVATADCVKTRERRQIADEDAAGIARVAETLAAAATKYTLLSVAPGGGIDFDIAKASQAEGNSAPFILYAYARIQSINRKFEARVAAGQYAPMPDVVDWSCINTPAEWEILTKLLGFASMLVRAVNPKVPDEPGLPQYETHLVPQFLFQIARLFGSYYGNTKQFKVLDGSPNMYPRVLFARAVAQVIGNALRLLRIKPLEAM